VELLVYAVAKEGYDDTQGVSYRARSAKPGALGEVLSGSAEHLKIAFLEVGGCEIEMMCHEGWEERKFADSADSHFPHLAFEVEDMEAGMRDLARKGVTFDHKEPQWAFEGKFCYNTFPGPDGEILEISRRR
jgi:catechol 2,3-dioxygenase-like lactoylglutathione lyase family enzyme